MTMTTVQSRLDAPHLTVESLSLLRALPEFEPPD